MSQLRKVFSGLAQSCTKPTQVPKPPLFSCTLLIILMRSSGVPITDAEPGTSAVCSTASSGDLKGVEPGRCSVAWMYWLCQRIRPCLASSIAFSRVSAMCQLSSTRQFLRSTVVPCFFADDSADAHCVVSAVRPSFDIEPSEMMPMPYLPARVMPDGLICEAVAKG